LDRRRFLHLAAASAGALALPQPAKGRRGQTRPVQELHARPATLDPGRGDSLVWTVNGEFPSPTLRVRQGDNLRARLVNGLDEPTILHWHGLTTPQEADGHPRLAIPPGATYDYDFTVTDAPGTYWYHPHPHRRTAIQTHLGMAGFLIVEGDEGVDLPTGEFDLPLLLQDRRVDASGGFTYAPSGPDLMLGFLGNTGFVNGRPEPTIEVRRGRYRLRLLNGCNARILDLRMSPDPGMVAVAADGGLLPAPQPLSGLVMGSAERVDVVVDFGALPDGSEVTLSSAAFQIPGMMTGPRGGPRGQMAGGGPGAPMLFARFRVGGERLDPGPTLPPVLRQLDAVEPEGSLPTRSFRFESAMMRHAINGREFEMHRVDERIALERPEIWTFVNDSALPHPVHVHLGAFRVIERRGGRGLLQPWETGTKDTVLVWPGEQVDVRVQFRRHAGLYLLHCHNLEHEDAGMMANFLVEDRPEV
jgi:FtsP/CotA-like multicopper oxidase with cupredoxin domain